MAGRRDSRTALRFFFRCCKGEASTLFFPMTPRQLACAVAQSTTKIFVRCLFLPLALVPDRKGQTRRRRACLPPMKRHCPLCDRVPEKAAVNTERRRDLAVSSLSTQLQGDVPGSYRPGRNQAKISANSPTCSAKFRKSIDFRTQSLRLCAELHEKSAETIAWVLSDTPTGPNGRRRACAAPGASREVFSSSSEQPSNGVPTRPAC